MRVRLMIIDFHCRVMVWKIIIGKKIRLREDPMRILKVSNFRHSLISKNSTIDIWIIEHRRKRVN